MKKKYGGKVFKIGLSMGEICHHRVNSGGCIFCLSETFTDKIKTQNIENQMAYLLPKMKKHAEFFIAYFQDETSFDLDFTAFKQKINAVLRFEEIKEITISTRPDVLNEKYLDYLSQLDKDVTIEIGAQTINDKSLNFLNRGHNFLDIQKAINVLKKYKMRIGVHLILGIPGEDFNDYLQTINYFNSQNIAEIKFHNLVAYQGTKLGEMVKKSEVKLLNLDEYLQVLLRIIPLVKREIIISRLFTSNVNRTGNAINTFPGYKKNWMNKLAHLMDINDVYQGKIYKDK